MSSARIDRMIRDLRAEPARPFDENLLGLAAFLAWRRPAQAQPQPQPQVELRLPAQQPAKA